LNFVADGTDRAFASCVADAPSSRCRYTDPWLNTARWTAATNASRDGRSSAWKRWTGARLGADDRGGDRVADAGLWTKRCDDGRFAE
jgi:hypothetical protein